MRDTAALEAYEESELAEDEHGEQHEEASSIFERKMMYRIFSNLQHDDVPRSTADEVYSALADALPVGSRCQKQGAGKGLCDLCRVLGGERATETTRHVVLECPFSALVHDAILRAAFGVSVQDEGVRVQQQGMTWRALLHEHRRLLVTSYRHCASGRLTVS